MSKLSRVILLTSLLFSFSIVQADVIPFTAPNNSANPTNTATVPTTTPTTTTVPAPTDTQTQIQQAENYKIQLNSSGGAGTGSTGTNAGNKAEQDDLYNQSVNKMLNGK